MHSIGEWWMWTGFIGFVLVMLALKLLAYWFHLPVWISLSVVAAILVTTAIVSILFSRPAHAKGAHP